MGQRRFSVRKHQFVIIGPFHSAKENSGRKSASVLKKTQVGNKLSINKLGLELEPQANQGTVLHAPLSPPVQGTSGPGRMKWEHPVASDMTHRDCILVTNHQVKKRCFVFILELPTALRDLYSSRHEVWGAPIFRGTPWPLRAALAAIA